MRAEPATEKQKEKLRYFGCAFEETISKGQASDALDKCARDFPEVDRAYYARPATEEQLEQLRAYLQSAGEVPDDYADEGKPLTYQQAKDLIWECKMQERMDNEAEDRRENLIALVARTDFYPSLTFELASKAAKVLDRIYPEWMEDKDNQDLLIKKVVELNPRLAADEQWPTEEHKSTPESRAAMNALLQEHGYYPNHPTADNCTNQTAPTEAQLQKVKELEFKMAKGSGITADKLAVILELQGQAARAEDLSVFRTHGITHFVGDALASYALRVVIGYFQELAQAEDWRNWDDMRILRSCQIAGNDPAFQEPSLTLDGFSRVTFSWPKRKLQEWFRKGAQF